MIKTEVYKNEIKSSLDKDAEYRSFLFKRGYLITDAELPDTDAYPFYGNWNVKAINGFKVLVHREQELTAYESDGISAVMIGHAYDPFTMQYSSEEILSDCIKAYKTDEAAYFDKISSLTGIHLILIFDKDKFTAVQDCSGMRYCCFGKVKGSVYVTSHPQLVADLCDLSFDPDVELLFSKKFYSLGANYLPGNITPYKELKRLGANTYLNFDKAFSIVRFYPTRPLKPFAESEYDQAITEIGRILHNNIELASKKWARPAISLSGGMDSKTTLSCTKGLYDKFGYYSFHAKKQEVIDAAAAEKLCAHIGVAHKTYAIPDSNDEIEDFYFLKKIIYHNTSYISKESDHEVRKFIYMSRVNDFDVELKSWVSEIGRVFLSNKYGFEMPTKLNERHLSIFQKRYVGSPYLLKWSDALNRDFMKEVGFTEPFEGYEHQDMFYWEIRCSSWEANLENTLDFFNLKTIPFNNRKLIEMLLRFPHDMRKNDVVHSMIIEKMNKAVSEAGILVHNGYLSKKRIFIERAFYNLRTVFFRSKL